jgi:putative glutamine amidotransferase
MKPVIAISSTSGEDKTKPYLETVIEHGGTPLLVKPNDTIDMSSIDGILLTGGGDLSECYYDHKVCDLERKTLGAIELEREKSEFKLMEWATHHDVPALGICRGFQMMNVFAKGTLIPDIPTWRKTHNISLELPHRNEEDSSTPVHEISVEPGTQLFKILDSQPQIAVNSSHHQALSRCGSSLKVTARSSDGIIEAVENPNHRFWIGVQFHPERMWRKFSVFSNLFRSLMEHAQRTAR